MKNYNCECIEGLPLKLFPGVIVQIQLLNDKGIHINEGLAKLVRNAKTEIVKEIVPYIDYCTKCKRQVNVSREKWMVEFTDPFLKGKVFPRNIIKFHSFGDIKISSVYDHEYLEFIRPFCLDYLEDEDLCTQLRRELLNQSPPTSLLKKFFEYIKEI